MSIIDIKGDSTSSAYRSFNIMHKSGAPVTNQWERYSEFRKWYLENQKEGRLFTRMGDSYSPSNCAFIRKEHTAIFRRISPKSDGLPTGVTKAFNKYIASFGGGVVGSSDTTEGARKLYVKARVDRLKEIKPELPENAQACIDNQIAMLTGEKPVADKPKYSVGQDLGLAKLYVQKAQSTKTRNIGFDLSFDRYRELMTSTHCMVTGVAFITNERDGPRWRTLDRIDSSLGYTDENTIAVTHEVNCLKNVIAEHPSGTIDAESFRKLAMFMLDNKSIMNQMDTRGIKL